MNVCKKGINSLNTTISSMNNPAISRNIKMKILKLNNIQKWFGLACVIAPLSGCKTMPEKPNVLVIMCDQMTTKVLDCYGSNDGVITPNIDRLAREGFVFQNATCAMPLSSPSRASIITGKYPHAHKVVDNVFVNEYPTIAPGLSHLVEEGIDNKDVTTEKILHEQGYDTHLYGKWHLMGDSLTYYPDMYREHYGYPQEMKNFFDSVRVLPRDQWMDWYGWSLPVKQSDRYRHIVDSLRTPGNGAGLSDFILKMGRLEMKTSQTFDDRIASRVIDAIKNAKSGQPFMLTASFNWPHDPNVVNDPYYSMYQPENIKLPANFTEQNTPFEQDLSRRTVKGIGEDGVREFLRIYYGCVTMVDDQIGRILAALDESGKTDNTIIVFLSDHGDMAGRHGMVWKSTVAFYDEVTQVPLIIRYPRAVKPGRTDEVVSLVDVMPTILEFTHHQIPGDIQGKSLVPLMEGKKTDRSGYVFSERVPWSDEHKRIVTLEAKGSFMVRSKEYKYCRFADGRECLYDLKNDPSENKNLAQAPDFTNRKQELSRVLEEWLVSTGYSGK